MLYELTLEQLIVDNTKLVNSIAVVPENGTSSSL
jgi:hypothetical protein